MRPPSHCLLMAVAATVLALPTAAFAAAAAVPAPPPPVSAAGGGVFVPPAQTAAPTAGAQSSPTTSLATGLNVQGQILQAPGVPMPQASFPSINHPAQGPGANAIAGASLGPPPPPEAPTTPVHVILDPRTVALAQSALAAAGLYQGPIDGVATGATRAALLRFQARAALPQTGLPDLATLSALGVPLGTPTSSIQSGVATAQAGMSLLGTTAGILTLQNELRALGALAEPPNGVFDAETQAALRALQAGAGIPTTGAIDAQTLTLLNQLLLQRPGAGTTPPAP